MRTFWAWRVVADSRAGFSRLTSAAIPRTKDLRGRSKVNNYFINFAHSFLFKSTMAADMNLFEQDPTFPFFGSAEDRASFYSAKFSRSDDKSSGGPIRKPRRSKVVLKMEYSKQCKKFWDLCRTLSKRNHLCRTVTTMCQSLSRNHPLWTRTTMSPFFHRRYSPPWPWLRLSTSMPLFGASTSLGNLGLRIRCGIIPMSLTS